MAARHRLPQGRRLVAARPVGCGAAGHAAIAAARAALAAPLRDLTPEQMLAEREQLASGASDTTQRALALRPPSE